MRGKVRGGCMVLLWTTMAGQVFGQGAETKLKDLFQLYSLDFEARAAFCVQQSYTEHKDPRPGCRTFHMEVAMSGNAWYQQISFCTDRKTLMYKTERPESWGQLKEQLVGVYGFDAPKDETAKETRFVRDSSVIVFTSTPGEGHLVNHYMMIERLHGEERSACAPRWDQGRFHAVLFAAQHYVFDGRGVDDLEWPIDEAKQLAKVLKEQYGFNVTIHEDPDHTTMVKALERLRGLTCDDHVVVFFAGHGSYDPATRKGYWLPVNADPGNRSDHFKTSDLIDHLGAWSAGHVLVLSDACYGGSIFNAEEDFEDIGARPTDADLKDLWGKPSRHVMTSGKIEPVPDESVFFQHFLGRLKSHQRTYLDIAALYASVLDDIKADRLEQPDATIPAPQFGWLRRTGHRKGSMILKRTGK